MKSSKKNRVTPNASELEETSPSNRSTARGKFWTLAYVCLGLFVIVVALIATRQSHVAEQPATTAGPSHVAAAPTSEQRRDPGILVEKPATVPATIVLPVHPAEIDVAVVEKEIVELGEQLVKQYPDDPRALHSAANTYSELLQTARAEELWKKCIALSPDFPDPYVGLAKVLMQGGHVAEAVETLQRAKAKDLHSADLVHEAAEAAEKLGNLAEAEKTLIDGTTQFPSAAKNWLRLAQVQIQLNRFAEAEASSRKAIELGEKGVPSFVALSTALARQTKTQEAAEVRKQLAELLREKDQAKSKTDTFQATYAQTTRRLATHAYALSGSIHLDHNALAAAEASFLRSLSFEPDQSPCYVALGSMYRKANRLQDAIAVHQRLVDLEPDNAVNYTNLASLLIQTGDEPLAEKVLRDGAEKNPSSGIPQWYLARYYLATGRNTEAFAAAQAAAEHLQTVDGYLLLISVCRATGDSETAARALEKALKIGPNDPRLANLRK